jgi:sulfite exporter TauE/SafE
MVVCTAACVPYLASYIAGVGAGFRKGIGITMIFNSGRITGYALLGALVGVFSGLFKLLAAGTAISPLQTYSSLIFGILTMAIGVFVLAKYRSAKCDCKPSPTNRFIAIGKKGRFGFDFGAFSLGLSRGLILCPPLVLLLIYAVPFSNPVGSVGLAVLFGLGTTLSPMLVLGGVTGWLLNKAPLFRKWVSIGGGAILILLGLVSLINSAIHI